MALSRDSMEFFKDVLIKAMPKPERPKLSPELEAKFKDIDARSAVHYSQMEVAAQRFRELAQSIDATPNPDATSDGTVIAEDDWEIDNDSTVHHVEELRKTV